MVTTCARISVMTGSQLALRRIVACMPQVEGAALWWNDAAKLDAKNKQPRLLHVAGVSAPLGRAGCLPTLERRQEGE